MIGEAKYLFSSLKLGADGSSTFDITSDTVTFETYIFYLISSFILSSVTPPKLSPSPFPFASCIPMRSSPTTWALVPAWFFHSNVRALALYSFVLHSPGPCKIQKASIHGRRSLTLKTRVKLRSFAN